MGKQRYQRRKPHKENPTGLPSVKDSEDLDDFFNEDREKALQRVYEEIQSPSVEEKLSGLQTLESMSCDAALAVEIAKNGIAKRIGPMLVDYNISVRCATASALRHIADNGGDEAYASLLKNDIMTPLSALLKQCYAMEWQLEESFKEKERTDDATETLIQAITLLWTLCENSEFAIKHCNEQDLSLVLLKFFDINIYGIEIGIAAAQCMLSLTDDNPTAIAILKRYENVLLDLLNLEVKEDVLEELSRTMSQVISLKTCIAGLIINGIRCSTENKPLLSACKVALVLSDTLTVDHINFLNTLTSILPHDKNTFSNTAKRKVQEAKRTFGAQQQALEILANLCSEDSDSDSSSELDDFEEMGDSENVDDDPINDNAIKISSALPVELIEVIANSDLVKKVWEKTAAPDDGTREILVQTPEGKAVLKQIHTLRCRAYLCLNNLVSNLEIDMLGGISNIYRIWSEIGAVVFKDANPNDIELLEAATAALRAVLEKLAEVRANIFEHLSLTDIQPILNGERQCPNPNVRANLIRTLGHLASILTNNNASDARELVKHISSFLLDTCKSESEAWVIAESLDTVMDIFAEDETDRLVADMQLVDNLRNLIPIFQKKVRQQRKTLGENRSVVSTVITNITRFIKYKEKQIKNLGWEVSVS